MKTTNTAPAAITLTVPEPAATLDRGERINYYHHLSAEAGRISIMAAIAAGCELHRAKEECEHGTFQCWIKKHCCFSQRTAYKYMLLTERLMVESNLPTLIDLPTLPEPERHATLTSLTTAIDTRTLTDLYTDLGIVKPSVNRMGGARPGAGRPQLEPSAETRAGAAWGLIGREIDRATAWHFERFLPEAMVREALGTVKLLQEALKERLQECRERT